MLSEKNMVPFAQFNPPPPHPPEVEIGLNCANGTILRNASLISCQLLRIFTEKKLQL